MYLENYTDN